MLSDIERETLLERQSRVYEVLDLATKPAQWLVGGLQLLLLAFLLVCAAIFVPIYALVTRQPLPEGSVITAVLALSGFVMFFLAPYYTVVGGLIYLVGFAYWDSEVSPIPLLAGYPARIFGVFIAFGYMQVLTRCFVQRLRRKAPAVGAGDRDRCGCDGSPRLARGSGGSPALSRGSAAGC